MKNKQIKWIGAAALSLVLIAVAAPSAFTEPAAPTLTANVVSQQCQGGDGVNVTLTAVLSPNRSGVLAWDFNGDGVLDTAPDANPTVTTVYPDEMVETATVSVIRNGRTSYLTRSRFRPCAVHNKQRFAKGERRTWNLRSPEVRSNTTEKRSRDSQCGTSRSI